MNKPFILKQLFDGFVIGFVVFGPSDVDSDTYRLLQMCNVITNIYNYRLNIF